VGKLTKAQHDMLHIMSDWGDGRPFRIAHVTYAPLRRLIRKRFVEKLKGRQGFAVFRITPAGRAALQQQEEAERG